MTDQTPDKTFTHGYWRDRAAYWDRNADGIADVADRLNQPLLDALDIAAGQHVLDLAAGAGEPALSIARRVGPEGRVVATDLVEEMLEGARRRASAERLANIRFQQADMEHLPFAEATFDRVACRFGLMFTSAPDRALAEARRVLKPGGRAGYLVWGPRADTTQFRVFVGAAERVFGSAAEIDLETPFRFGAAGSLSAPMAKAGFEAVEERELRFEPRIPVSLPFWQPQVEMTFGPLLERAGPAEREALEAALAEGFAAFRDDGHYRLKMHVRIGLGRRASGNVKTN